MKEMTEFFRGASAKKRTVPILSMILMACLLLGSSKAFAAQVAYYPLDGNANDSSANGYNGTVNEATFVTGRDGNAASFDNVNDDITVSSLAGNLPGGNSARTVALWVKPSTTADNGNMVSWGAPAAGQRFSLFMQAGGRLDVIGQGYDFQSTYTMSAGAWQHVAVTYDGTNLKFYANGVLQGTSTAGAFNTDASNALRIGTNVVGWNTEYFGGEIDDVRIFNTALPASEIWALAYLTGGSVQGGPLDLTIGHSDVTTLAGLAGNPGGTDGTGSAARFSSPHGLTTDGTNLYVADHTGHVIRKVVISTGQVTTLAGLAGSAGGTDGTGSAAQFNQPTTLATDGVNLYVADYNNHTVRKIVLSTGVVTTLAGSAGLAGSTDGTGSAARFNYPNGLTMVGGYLYLSEMGNHTIRRISMATAAVTTIAGSAGLTGTTDATGTAARFNTPCGVTTDGTNLYVVDLNNYTVRKIVISSGAVTTLAGTAGVSNWLDGTGTAAQFKGIEMITTDGTYLYVGDWGSSTIRRIAISTGVVTTIAGSNGLAGSTDGLGSAARFNTNEGLTTDGTNLFIADRGNHTIRKISYVNSAPIITSNGGGATAAISVSENQTAVTTVTTTDTNSDTITYSITGGSDSAQFSINSSTGVLTFVSAPDYENPTDSDTNNTYVVTVQASDGSLTDSQTITVTVTNVNEAPAITSNGGGATAAISVAENQTAVTTVTATDVDSTPTFSITGGSDSAKFAIGSSDGVLTFVSVPDFETPTDSDANNTYIIEVTVSDGTLTDVQTITVTVTNVNDVAPSITSNGGGATASVNAAENQTAVTTVTATDADGPSTTYSISGGTDSAKFTINSSSGVLTFVSAPDFETPTDSDANNTYIIEVTVSDGTLTDVQTITVTVTNVDEMAPTLNGTASYVNPTHVDVTFSEAVNGALTATNYTGNNGLTISAVADQGGNVYRLTTSLQAIGTEYTITANSITDLAGNAIDAANKTATFTRTANSAPTIPVINTPADAAEATVLTPTLTVNVVTDAEGDPATYTFEVSAASDFSTIAATTSGVADNGTVASWTLPSGLSDNTLYYWRVLATDGNLNSAWMATASFFVNTGNDAPTAPGISSPANSSQVSAQTPQLSVTNGSDVDNDVLTYSFDVATDNGFNTVVANTTGVAQGSGATSWTVSTALNDNATYYWRARATDEHGASSGYATGSFFVNTANDAPTAPILSSPANNSETLTLTPTLAVNNSTDADGDTLSYIFEADTVNTFDSGNKQTSALTAEGSGTTSWTPANLNDNTTYYWRAKANDGTTDSGWMTTASFFVNTENDVPTAPTLNNPADNAEVTTLTPSLIVNAATDIDNDALTYDFEVYSDSGLTTPVSSSTGEGTSWTVSSSTLSDNTTYYWRARAKDEHGLAGSWMAANSFFVNNNGTDDAPSITVTKPGTSESATNANTFTIQWTDSDPDSNAAITLYYDTDNTGNDGTEITTGITEDSGTSSYTWNTSSLADGTYYVYAKIDDGTTTVYAYGDGPVVIDRTAPSTTASPAGGTYTSAQSVALTCSDGTGSGCDKIYYTTNGTTPTTSSTVYSSPISISATTTLKFFAKDLTGNSETVDTAAYTINTIAADTTAPTVTASPSGGTYSSSQTVTLTCSDGTGSGCSKRYYTTDGTTPTTSSTVYVSPISIAETTTLNFFAKDKAGNSSAVSSETYTINPVSAIDATAPSNVTNLNATSKDDGSIYLSWTAPTGADLKGYNVYRDNVMINSETITESTVSYTDSDTVSGTTYTYKVTSLDLAGNESAGVTVRAAGAALANTPPSELSSIKVEDAKTGGSLRVVWTAGTEADIDGYKVYIGTSSGNYTNVYDAGNTTSYTATGLVDGSKYYIAVTAYDKDGNESSKSAEYTETPTTATIVLDPPTNLTVSSGNHQLTLSWTGVTGVTGYLIYVGKSEGAYGAPMRTAGTSFNFRRLRNNKTMYVAVSSYTLKSGSSNEIEAESQRVTTSGMPADTTPPASPAGLEANTGISGKVGLKWNRGEEFDLAGYVIAYKESSSSVYSEMIPIGAGWIYVIDGLTDGTSYDFSIYAYDKEYNFSEPSSISATPAYNGQTADDTPPSPPTFSAVPGDKNVILTVTPSSDCLDANGSNVCTYTIYVYNQASEKYKALTSMSGLSYEHSESVENGQALTYVATATDSSGNESGYSEEAGAVPAELTGEIPLEEDPPVSNRVDGYDINEMATAFGTEIGDLTNNPNADLDGNGEVGGSDLMLLGTNYGKSK